MNKFFTLILILLFTGVSAQELPLFDFPVQEQNLNNSAFGPGGDLEGLTEKAEVSMSVSNPQPGQDFVIRVDSYSTDLNNATISWYSNNILLTSKKGAVEQKYTGPNTGSSLIIDIIIKTAEGNTIEKTYEISPSLVNLVYESNTYTPPFYEGKAIYTNQSSVKIIALPNIVEDGIVKKDSELIYTWEVNGSAQQSSSGYGKNSFIYNAGILSKPVTVSVLVESDTSNQVATNELFLSPGSTELIFAYEHPLYGLQYNGNRDIETTNSDLTIHAIPLFFSIGTRNSSDIDYIWSINGGLLGDSNNSSVISFQSEEGEGGTMRLSLQADSTKKILQSSNNSVNVSIEKVSELIQRLSEDFSF
jgi:hypothetical protein